MKMNKFLSVFVFLFLVVVTGCSSKPVTQKTEELEVGATYTKEDLFESKEGVEFSVNKEKITPDKVGELTVTVTANEESYDYTFKCVDKTGPTIEQVEDKLALSDSYDINKLIKVSDNVDSEKDITIKDNSEELDLVFLGEHTITVTATDKSGNETTQDIVFERVPDTKPLKKGQVIKSDNVEITFKSAEFSYDVKPSNPDMFYSHYAADPGKVFIYVKCDVKNIGKQTLRCDEIYSATAYYKDDYKYDGFSIVRESGDTDFTYSNITNIDPLETVGVDILIECPQEVEENKGGTVRIELSDEIDGGVYSYDLRK